MTYGKNLDSVIKVSSQGYPIANVFFSHAGSQNYIKAMPREKPLKIDKAMNK